MYNMTKYWGDIPYCVPQANYWGTPRPPRFRRLWQSVNLHKTKEFKELVYQSVKKSVAEAVTSESATFTFDKY